MGDQDLPLTAMLPRLTDAFKFFHTIRNAATDEGYQWSKDDVKTLQFWVKQAVAVAVGILLPILDINGATGFMAAVVAAFLVTMITKQRLNIPDDVMSTSELFNEGLPQCFQLFVLAWLCAFTFLSKN